MLAFNDVLEHDIDAPYIQDVLSLGLEKAYQIASTETYEDRERLLCSDYSPFPTCFSLYEGLREANERRDEFFLDELTPEEETRYIRGPIFADPGPGPTDI